MNWFVFIILSIVMFFTPYQRGLFFDSDMYLWEVAFAILFIIYGVWSLKKPKPFPWIYLGVFLLPFMYFLSLFVAETPKGAFDLLFRWVMYACFFCLVLGVRSQEKIKKYLPIVFQSSGIIMVALALAGFWGWFHFQDLIWSDRLTGTFQYPNTFGTLMGAFWVYSVVVLSKKELKLWETILFGLPLVAFLSTLLLSQSRGTFLALPVAWLIGLILLKVRGQIVYILNTVISAAVSLIAFRSMDGLRTAGASHPGLVSFWGGTLFVLVLVLGISFFFKGDRVLRLEKLKKIRFVLPILLVVFGVLLTADLMNQGLVYKHLPATLQERISSINTGTYSVVGRTNFYEDAIKMSKDAPVLGLGGDGWKVLFTKYEHQPYWSTQTHNGYLETLLNTGWLGIVVFIIVFAFFLLQIVRRIREENNDSAQAFIIATIPALAVIFLHAIVDFDFSYGSVWLVVFWLFAMGVTENPIEFKARDAFATPWIGKSVLGILMLVVVISCFIPFRFYLSDQAFAKVNEGQSPQEMQKGYEKSISDNPYDVNKLLRTASFYSQVYQQTKQQDIMQRVLVLNKNMEDQEPNNPQVLAGIANNLLVTGDSLKSLEYINKAITNDPYNVAFYDQAVYLESELARSYLKSDKNKSNEMAKNSIINYETFVKLTTEYKKNPIPNIRPLDFAKKTYFYLGQSYLLAGDYPKALDAFSQINEKDDQVLQKQSYAGKAIAYELLGKTNDAKNLEQLASKQYPDFTSFINNYKKELNAQ